MGPVVDESILMPALEEGLLREDQVVLEEVELLLIDSGHSIVLILSSKARCRVYLLIIGLILTLSLDLRLDLRWWRSWSPTRMQRSVRFPSMLKLIEDMGGHSLRRKIQCLELVGRQVGLAGIGGDPGLVLRKC